MVRRSLVKVKVRPAFASHSYCSNPDDDEFGVWCYTKDPNVRWEYCNVPKCDIQDSNTIGLVANAVTTKHTKTLHSNNLVKEFMGAHRVKNVTFATSDFDTWTEWTEWSRCSKSCGIGGVKLRHRICPNKTCQGNNLEEAICDNPLCHSWAEWSNWSQCSMTCIEQNARNIPKTYRYQYKNTESIVDDFNSRVQHCRSNSMIHEELHRRKRIQKDFFESEVCEDDHAIRTDVQPCPLPVCPSWAKWANWSDCSQSCDGGHRQRYRKCLHPNGDNGDGTCVGIFAEEQECNQKKCRK